MNSPIRPGLSRQGAQPGGPATIASRDVPREAAIRELFPIKLVGGFIAVDQHVGCFGCRFCLSRRHPIWRRIFSAGLHSNSALTSPGETAELLLKMRPFTQARVPVRFGHNTDASFQWTFGEQLYRLLPPKNPFIFMTRIPLTPERACLFKGQPNLLCKLTVTPASQWLGLDDLTGAAIDSIAWVPRENLFVLVGPLATDSIPGAREVLRALPVGTWVDVKALTRTGIDPVANVPVPSTEELDALRREAAERGLIVTDYFGCLMRQGLQRPFYKADETPDYIARACAGCRNNALCLSPQGAWIEEEIRSDAATIGIVLGGARRLGPRTTSFDCVAPTSRGDETFLSERHNHRVLLSSVPCGSLGGSFSLEEGAVLDRWEEFGMFPSSQVRELAERTFTTLGLGGAP